MSGEQNLKFFAIRNSNHTLDFYAVDDVNDDGRFQNREKLYATNTSTAPINMEPKPRLSETSRFSSELSQEKFEATYGNRKIAQIHSGIWSATRKISLDKMEAQTRQMIIEEMGLDPNLGIETEKLVHLYQKSQAMIEVGIDGKSQEFTEFTIDQLIEYTTAIGSSTTHKVLLYIVDQILNQAKSFDVKKFELCEILLSEVSPHLDRTKLYGVSFKEARDILNKIEAIHDKTVVFKNMTLKIRDRAISIADGLKEAYPGLELQTKA